MEQGEGTDLELDLERKNFQEIKLDDGPVLLIG